jgi:hypothetical protein
LETWTVRGCFEAYIWALAYDRRHFQRWVARGVLDRIWATVQEACEDLGGCDWEWQAADGWLGKARLGGTSWAPTPLIGPRTA